MNGAAIRNICSHDDVIKWKHFPRYWAFVRGIHRWPVSSPHKGQWRGALMFSFICAWINGWVNNCEAGDLRRHRAHYDVTVMQERLCNICNAIEGEKHFLFECCSIQDELRFIFESRVRQLYPQYQYLYSNEKLVFLCEEENEQLITWFGKSVNNSFCLREEYHGKKGLSGNSNHTVCNGYKATFLILIPYVKCNHTTCSITIRQQTVITIQCVTIYTVDSILCMYDFMLWLLFHFMPRFYMCIPCFYYVSISWNVHMSEMTT